MRLRGRWAAVGLLLAALPGWAQIVEEADPPTGPETAAHFPAAHRGHHGTHKAATPLALGGAPRPLAPTSKVQLQEVEAAPAPGGAAPGELASEWARLQRRGPHGAGQELPPGDDCAAILSVPKVALLFLTRGKMHHERTWELWFENARGLLPRAALKGTGCSDSMLEALSLMCTPEGGSKGGGAIQGQHLANVYLHVDANEGDFQGFAPGSLFHGLDIEERVHVWWGSHALVEATTAMLQVALQDPANAKFVLLSESDVPLYPLQTVWIELLWEAKSRIAACERTGGWNPERWHPEMEEEAGVTIHSFRKTSQWFSLNRKHVEAAVNDTAITQAFKKHCSRHSGCISDEHFFSTLLAVKGLEGETDCRGETTHTEWRGRPGSEEHHHPVSWPKEEVTADKFRELRQTQPLPQCDAAAALASTPHHFLHTSQLAGGRELCAADAPPFSGSLGNECMLFARKFAPDTAELVTAVLADCSSGLHVLGGEGSCPPPAAEPPQQQLALRSRRMK